MRKKKKKDEEEEDEDEGERREGRKEGRKEGWKDGRRTARATRERESVRDAQLLDAVRLVLRGLAHAHDQLVAPRLADRGQPRALRLLVVGEEVVRGRHARPLRLEVERPEQRREPGVPRAARAQPHRALEVGERRAVRVVVRARLGPLGRGRLWIDGAARKGLASSYPLPQ